MGKTWIAILASVFAVVVLAALIVNSRSVGVQDYNSHYQKLNIIDQSLANFESLLDQLAAARRDGLVTGSGVSLIRNRLASNKDALSRVDDGEAHKGAWSVYDAELKSIIELSTLIESNQNTVGHALQRIRDDGPQEVQKLKAAGYDVESQAFYRLLLKTLALGAPGGANNTTDQISTTVAALKENGNLLSTSVVGMIDAIEKVINTRGLTEATWAKLNATEFTEVANNLRGNYSTAHSERMRKTENSRILLSIYSVLLFGGLGLLGYRLQSSYREINDVNEQLVDANDGLEKRVEERTQDLEKAFDELKESQVQLVQAEKMSSLGQLVAGISHEINTPLLYLQSNQTLIKETLVRVEQFIDMCHDKLVPRGSLTEDKEAVRQRYVKGLQELKQSLIEEEIKEELNELKTLTDDNIEGLEELTVMAQGLKDFSRLDRAPIDSFNVNDGIKRTLIIAKNMLKEKVNVVQQLNEVPLVRCSPSQINQIFLNLVTNAAQAMDGAGDITITTSTENGFVSVEVADTGCGIPAEIMSKIRDPFFTTKEVGSGTGLGLSIVEEILRAHNGRLDIQSEVGKGSVFTVLLPYKAVDTGGAAESDFGELFDAAAESETSSDDASVLALVG